MRQLTQKIKVENYSLTAMQEYGWDVEDTKQNESVFYARFVNKEVMRQLTDKQQKIVICLSQGDKRYEIAKKLMISLQETHQIIARIRRRLEGNKLTKEDMDSIKSLVWLFHYYTNCSAEVLYQKWQTDEVLSDYPRPTLGTIKKWIRGYKAE